MKRLKISLLLAITSALLLPGCSCSNSDFEEKPDSEFGTYFDPEKVHYSFTDIRGNSEADDFWYSDDYFCHRASRYNPHLATLSIEMAKYSMNRFDPNNKDDTEWYEHQSDRVKTFYDTIGFQYFQCNEDYRSRTDFDTIGVAVAQRTIHVDGKSFTVVALTVRSGGYFLEWSNNVYLGDGSKTDMMHEGWYNAAMKAYDFLGNYLAAYHIYGQTKIWLSGYSRGGAVTNILAGILDNKLGKDDIETRKQLFHEYDVSSSLSIKREDIITYTFEAPQGANFNSSLVNPKDDLYNNIFNIVNPNDFVTKIPMCNFGFTRFGIDKFITTEFYDPDNFDENRRSTKTLLEPLLPGYDWVVDNYTMKGLDYFGIFTDVVSIINLEQLLVGYLVNDNPFPSDIIKDDNTKKRYDANINASLVIDVATHKIGSRANYCQHIQDFAVNLMKYVMNDDKKSLDRTWKEIAVALALQAVAYEMYGDLDSVASVKDITGISDQDLSFVLDVGISLFDNYPSDIITLISNIKDAFENHTTDVNVAHARAQDSYFIDDYNANKKPAEEEDIKLVSYRDSASYMRLECHNIDDGHIYEADNDNRQVIEMSGSNFIGDAEIKTCRAGYAVGYYTYGTEEATQWFFPIDKNYKVSLYSVSIKIDYNVYIIGFSFISNNKDGYAIGHKIEDNNYTWDAGPFSGTIDTDGVPHIHHE